MKESNLYEEHETQTCSIRLNLRMIVCVCNT